MTPEEKNFQLRHDRQDARQCLHDTLSEVGAKIESAEQGLRPDHLIESHALGSSLIAGALGFIFGSTSRSRIAGPIIIAALVGFALSKRSTSHDDEQRERGQNSLGKSAPESHRD
jgi:hypothetical protein